MSPELIAILAVGIALAGLLLDTWRVLRGDTRAIREEMRAIRGEMRAARRRGLFAEPAPFAVRGPHEGLSLRRETQERLATLDRGYSELRERLARLEGLLDGLREAVAGRRTEAAE